MTVRVSCTWWLDSQLFALALRIRSILRLASPSPSSRLSCHSLTLGSHVRCQGNCVTTIVQLNISWLCFQGNAPAPPDADVPSTSAMAIGDSSPALGQELPEGTADQEAMKKAVMKRKDRIAYDSIQRDRKSKRARVEQLKAKRDALKPAAKALNA